jgi:hypothetical protein
MKQFKALVACEESQAVTIELRKRGWEAYSCDIQECSGGHPEWHVCEDVIPLVNGNCTFRTMDGVKHTINGKWDLIIAHPPCTYLTVTGNRWFNVERYGEKAIQRAKDREEAVEFFMVFANADCDHICIENPVGCMSTRWRKADQIIQPWMFGDPFEKKTCLWLEGLKPLVETNVVEPAPRKQFASGNTMPAWYADAWHLPKEERSRLRSKTFPGIAEALAEQFTLQITGQNDLSYGEAM